MSKAPRSADGLTALRALRRALLRAGVAAGSLAVAVVMLLGHGSDRPMRYADTDPGVDEMMTGSISSGQRYVVTRSVLQAPGSAPCLLFPDGSRRGNC